MFKKITESIFIYIHSLLPAAAFDVASAVVDFRRLLLVRRP